MYAAESCLFNLYICPPHCICIRPNLFSCCYHVFWCAKRRKQISGAVENIGHHPLEHIDQLSINQVKLHMALAWVLHVAFERIVLVDLLDQGKT